MKIILFAMVVLVLTTISSITTTNAFAHSAVDNNAIGFQDGLADCASGPGGNHLNGHSNAGHHSSAYMKGYDEGLNNCSDPSGQWVSGGKVNGGQNSIDNSNQNNREQAQSQGLVQHVFCVNVFGNCPATSAGQSQGLNN